jgi:hypothetical protein
MKLVGCPGHHPISRNSFGGNILRIVTAIVCLAAPVALAQQLQLPSKSPGAKVTQTVGLTDITIEYSSPGVKGRKIWGAVVKYNEVWRAGANAATKLTFSKDVTIEDTVVPAGSYAFFAIPTPTTWTLILSKTANQSGAFNYKKEDDLLRVTVKPTAIPLRERLAYLVSNFTDDTASIDLEWEKVRVSLPVKMKTKEQATAAIAEAVDNAWRPMTNAARYLVDQKDWAGALEKVNASIALKETWLNDWVKAQALAGQGNYKEAYPLAEKAQTLGEQNKKDFFAAEDVKKALAEWKNKT